MVNNKTKKNKKNNKIFSNDHYKSNDGMLTSIWGPGMWHFLHTMSFNYPVNPSEEDKVNYRKFVLSLVDILPCGKCRKNFKKNLSELPLHLKLMKNRDSFSKYVYDLHEHVNKMLGKDSGLTYEDVRERYEHFRARCTQDKPIKKSEDGCVEPLYGKKAKCVLQIIPEETKCETMIIDPNSKKKHI